MRSYVDLKELIENTVDFLRSQAEEKSQSLSLDIEEGFQAKVYADPKALESVVSNLINNAVKYTQENGTIQVRVGVDDKWAKVEVEDNGFGMSEEDKARIFERFYRIKNSNTRYISGTGLGLPIVKGLLDDLGGKIQVESEPEKGSTFTVWLPML